MTESVGLSVGATNLAAVAVGRAAVTRPAVLTRERGPVFTDFVDRVGDPVGLVAADGSTHRAEAVLTEALRALRAAVPAGGHTGISHPAHWQDRQVDALRAALAAAPELRTAPLFSDAGTALTALADNPGLPARGVVVLCDFGGTGTSITVADAANGYQPIAPTVRHPELSGALIDQMLLTQVLAGVPGAVDAAGTSAIGSLTRLRMACRTAKEQLSGAAAASVAVDLPGHRTPVRITRDELDAVLRAPLADFLTVLQDTLQRSGIRPADVVAVASVGGGARIPAVTAALSERFRAPVVTMPQPELAAAIGAGIRAARGPADDGATAVAPLAAMAAPVGDPAMSSTFRALAWSQDTDEIPDPEPFVVDNPIPPRPEVHFTDREEPAAEPDPWYRRPALLLGTGAAVVLAVCVAAVVFVMRTDQAQTPAPPDHDGHGDGEPGHAVGGPVGADARGGARAGNRGAGADPDRHPAGAGHSGTAAAQHRDAGTGDHQCGPAAGRADHRDAGDAAAVHPDDPDHSADSHDPRPAAVHSATGASASTLGWSR